MQIDQGVPVAQRTLTKEDGRGVGQKASPDIKSGEAICLF